MARSPSNQVMVGGGLLCLVMHTTLSILLPVTVNTPAMEESIVIVVGGTRKDKNDQHTS